ncbi:Hypothetical protein Ccan_23500 [Capnocytophaga canimorsus Cc5]|uniref:Uncharacterized protein n=1 Tax=Capnocytophaga canimorsus (strain 5) TaxID=860228 RepID=F9YVW1_CAPCC|nr:Hypothetical protein Ccan_23500 [Capnocytophaga canimorsus Cc5]
MVITRYKHRRKYKKQCFFHFKIGLKTKKIAVIFFVLRNKITLDNSFSRTCIDNIFCKKLIFYNKRLKI